MFSVKWNLKDLVTDKPVKVFSIFSCGGGSTMGYKRAGFAVLGNCEIDPQINEIYKKNHHPKYNFNMDARDFLRADIPEELYDLDILDGSPPAAPFLCAENERTDGEKRKFSAKGRKNRHWMTCSLSFSI